MPDALERAVARVSRIRNTRWLLWRLTAALRRSVALVVIETNRVMLRRAETPAEIEWCARVQVVLKRFLESLDDLTKEGDRMLPPGPLPRKITHRARKTSIAATLFTLLALAVFPLEAADPARSVRLLGLDFLAQGCPVAPTTLLTARHVATRSREGGRSDRVAAIWQDERGHVGTVWTEDVDVRRDLAVMTSDVPFDQIIPRAAAAPAIGEKLTLSLYDTKPPLALKPVTVTVLNVVAGRLLLTPKSRPGSSGGCVLNGRGELVAIVQGQLTIDDQPFGLAVGVWGPWADVSWEFP